MGRRLRVNVCSEITFKGQLSRKDSLAQVLNKPEKNWDKTESWEMIPNYPAAVLCSKIKG